jgi:hypothetical protein
MVQVIANIFETRFGLREFFFKYFVISRTLAPTSEPLIGEVTRTINKLKFLTIDKNRSLMAIEFV